MVPTCWLVSEGNERGAYLAALAYPAAWLLLRFLPAAWHGLVVATGAVVALAMWSNPAHDPWRPEFATGLLKVAEEQPSFIVVGTWTERDAIAVLSPTYGVQVLDLWNLGASDIPNPRIDQLGPALDLLVDGLHSHGGRLVLTNSALAGIRNSPVPLMKWIGAEHLPLHFVCTPIERDGFQGVVVSRK